MFNTVHAWGGVNWSFESLKWEAKVLVKETHKDFAYFSLYNIFLAST